MRETGAPAQPLPVLCLQCCPANGLGGWEALSIRCPPCFSAHTLIIVIRESPGATGRQAAGTTVAWKGEAAAAETGPAQAGERSLKKEQGARLLSCPLPAGRHPSRPKTAHSWHSQIRMTRTGRRGSQPSAGGSADKGAPLHLSSRRQLGFPAPCTTDKCRADSRHSGQLLGRDAGGKRPGAGCPLTWALTFAFCSDPGGRAPPLPVYREAHVTNREGGSEGPRPPSSHPPLSSTWTKGG